MDNQEKTQSPGLDMELMAQKIDIRRVYIEILQKKISLFFLFCMLFSGFVLYAHYMKPKYQAGALIKVESSIDSGDKVSALLSSVPFISSQKNNSTAFEKALIKSSYILRELIARMNLDILAKPKYFPMIGRWLASSYTDNGIAPSKFGFNKYAWGGQNIAVSKLSVNYQLLGEKLTLKVLPNHQYGLYAPSGYKILTGTVGKLATSQTGVSIQVDTIKGKVGNEFIVRKVGNDKLINQISASLDISDPDSAPGSRFKHDTGMLAIKYTAASWQHSVKLLNTLLQVIYDKGAQLKSDQAGQLLNFINKQIPTALDSLKKSESDLVEYQSKTGNIDMQQEYMYLMKDLSSRQLALEQAKLDKVVMLQKYTSTHPYVVTLSLKIGEMKQAVEAIKKKMRMLPMKDKKSLELIRDIKTKNEMYIKLLMKRQEAEIIKSGKGSNVTILSKSLGDPLLVPSNKNRIIFLGFLLSLLAPVFFIVIKQLLDKTVSDPEVLSQGFGIDIKASVPFSNSQANKKELGRFLLAENKPNDYTVEVLRSIRTNLLLELMECQGNVVSIVSGLPAAGKSFFSSNLAFLLQSCGKKVLLIDADLRRGYLYKTFGLNKGPGLTDVIKGEVSLTSALQKGDKSSLYFLSAGSTTTHTAELLSNNRLTQLITEAKKDFDIVVIDTAPILLLTDGIVASKQADLTLMVVPSGVHTMPEIQQAVEQLNRNNIKLSGFVMNYTSEQKNGYGYGYGYGYKNTYESSGYSTD